MDEKKKFNYRLFAWVLTVFFTVLGFLFIQQYFKVRELEKYKNENIESIKDAKQKIIAEKKNEIDSLKSLNIDKDLLISDAKFRIDSLKRNAVQIRYVYRDRIEKINGFSGKELEDYWKNEFK